MNFGFSYIGLIWLIMLTVPNLIWTKNQPKDYEKYSAKDQSAFGKGNSHGRLRTFSDGTASR